MFVFHIDYTLKLGSFVALKLSSSLSMWMVFNFYLILEKAQPLRNGLVAHIN